MIRKETVEGLTKLLADTESRSLRGYFDLAPHIGRRAPLGVTFVLAATLSPSLDYSLTKAQMKILQSRTETIVRAYCTAFTPCLRTVYKWKSARVFKTQTARIADLLLHYPSKKILSYLANPISKDLRQEIESLADENWFQQAGMYHVSCIMYHVHASHASHAYACPESARQKSLLAVKQGGWI